MGIISALRARKAQSERNLAYAREQRAKSGLRMAIPRGVPASQLVSQVEQMLSEQEYLNQMHKRQHMRQRNDPQANKRQHMRQWNDPAMTDRGSSISTGAQRRDPEE